MLRALAFALWVFLVLLSDGSLMQNTCSFQKVSKVCPLTVECPDQRVRFCLICTSADQFLSAQKLRRAGKERPVNLLVAWKFRIVLCVTQI